MREIKFRAWDNDIKKMLYQTRLEYFDDAIQFRFDGDILANEQDLSIMQYTGLKDKNSKEIYEGDIVIYHKEVSPIVDKHRYIAKWDEEGELLFWHDPVSLNVIAHDLVEIIGNIYENPELLKEDEE